MNQPELVKPLLGDDGDDSKDPATTYHEQYKPTWLIALAILPPILPFFWSYHVDITDDNNLSFGYSTYMTSKNVSLSNVISAQPFLIEPLRQWGGWGIRYRFFSCNQTGYISSGGPGVLVKLNETNNNNKESVYVFSCQEPEIVCKILNKNKNKNNAMKHELD